SVLLLLCWRGSCFFTTRRRNTTWPRDWSSAVCSSDLRRSLGHPLQQLLDADISLEPSYFQELLERMAETPSLGIAAGFVYEEVRSEERRVGKECRCRLWPYD